MISLLALLGLLWAGDPCSVSVEPPEISVSAPSLNSSPVLTVARSYGRIWGFCAKQQGAKPPRLLITAKDEAGTEVLFDSSFELPGTVGASGKPVRAEVQLCPKTPPNRRARDAMLHGTVGTRRWHNPRTIEVELIAEGPLSPLAFKTQTTVYCRACSDDDRAYVSFYVNDFKKQTAKVTVSLSKERYECAKGGGRILWRQFWAEPSSDAWQSAVHPYEVVEHFEERLRPQGEKMVYEAIEPTARYCKPGKQYVFEVVGMDEFAKIMAPKNYGPSSSIYRNHIEFLKCP